MRKAQSRAIRNSQFQYCFSFSFTLSFYYNSCSCSQKVANGNITICEILDTRESNQAEPRPQRESGHEGALDTRRRQRPDAPHSKSQEPRASQASSARRRRRSSRSSAAASLPARLCPILQGGFLRGILTSRRETRGPLATVTASWAVTANTSPPRRSSRASAAPSPASPPARGCPRGLDGEGAARGASAGRGP